MLDIPIDVLEMKDFYTNFGISYDEWLEQNAPLYVDDDVEHWEQEKEFEDLDLEL